jgi:1-aminocyclopropane-1-carboxylate deaminase
VSDGLLKWLLYHFNVTEQGFMQLIHPPSALQRLESCLFPGVNLWVKRDDLLHPTVSGNKFRKLKYPLLALQGSPATVVTMGGPWSNHLHATAHAASLAGFSAIGLVRGFPGADATLSATLLDCQQLGMQIQFVTREAYRILRDVPDSWRRYVTLPDHASGKQIWLPEGGSTPQALPGVAEMVDELLGQLSFVPDTVIVACGTGATLAGILAGMQGRGQVLGVAAIKNASYLHAEIAILLQQASYPAHDNYELLTEFQHGGYAKLSPELRRFYHDFVAETGIPIEPVYTAKMFYALHKLVESGKFRQGERIVAIHTGGLQGARGFLI